MQTPTTPPPPRPTPWGPSQTERQLAPGIVRYDTAGHGGVHLADERWADFTARFPGVTLYAGPQWFEEDCDVSWVYIAFPETAPSEQALYYSVETVRHFSPEQAHLIPAEIVARAEAWYAANSSNYHVGSICSGLPSDPPGLWHVSLISLDGADRAMVFMTYPNQPLYTPAEVSALRGHSAN